MVTHTFNFMDRPQHIAEVTPCDMLPVGGPVYDPPYETPLEDELAWHLVKYLHRGCRLHSQVRVSTPCGIFWVDFVIECRGRRIALECGPLDEAPDLQQERYRDALIVGSTAFDVLYRLSGKRLFHHMEDLLYLLARWHPQVFTERALINLNRLASPEARAFDPPSRPSVLYLHYDGEVPVRLARLRLNRASDWVHDHDAALAEYGAVTPLALGA